MFPATTEEVSEIVKISAAYGVPVIRLVPERLLKASECDLWRNHNQSAGNEKDHQNQCGGLGRDR